MESELTMGEFSYEKIRYITVGGVTYFSVIDFIGALTDSADPQVYWPKLKEREPELLTFCQRFKLISNDSKLRLTDCTTATGLLRILMSVPSPKADPAKKWLATVGGERIEEMKKPELGIKRANDRAVENWRKQGKSERWIKARLRSVAIRHNFTDSLKECGITSGQDYAKCTAKVYQSSLNASVPKIRETLDLAPRDSIRDNLPQPPLMAVTMAEELVVSGLESGYPLSEALKKQAEVSKALREQYERTYNKPLLSPEASLDFGA